MATGAFKPMSLEDDAFIQGGLLQDVDVEIVEAQWVPWDYGKPGVVSQDVLAVKMLMVQLDDTRKPVTGPDGAPAPPVEQFWSAGGNFADVVVTDDGYMVGAGPNKSALTKGSNFHVFLQTMRAKGMPVGYLEDGNLSKLKGVKFHLIRTAAPKRDFQTGRAGKEREDTIAVCGSIIWGPWDGKPAAAVKGKAGPVAVANKGAGAAPASTPAHPSRRCGQP
jgi:hypothetical protein